MKDFKATITDPERKAQWQNFLGTDTVCVKSPLPIWAHLPGRPNSAVYLLDLDELTEPQMAGLIRLIAQRFNLDESDVAQNIRAEGVPILAEHCIVTIENPIRWIS